MKVAYYPGNVARGAMMEVEDCIQPLCKTLGIDLIELPKATSDGGNIIRQASPRLQHALAARNLALAEEKGLDIMTSCATSHSIHCDTAATMDANPVLASQLNNLIARTSKIEYAGEAKSRHLLHLLVEEIGLDKVKALVLNPLNMKVAAYYGPYMQREGREDPASNFVRYILTAADQHESNT